MIPDEIKPIKGRGGAGRGQGRKPSIAKVVKAAIAQAVFRIWGGEAQAWGALAQKISETGDLRLLFEVLRYWTDHEHGKAGMRLDVSGKIEHEHTTLDAYTPEELESLRQLAEIAIARANSGRVLPS